MLRRFLQTGNRGKDVDRKDVRILCFSILCPLLMIVAPLSVEAAPQDGPVKDSVPPHLIQTVTQQDLYEGMIALDMLQCPVLKEPDCEKAFENVKSCVVRVNMGNAYGSGILWEMTADQVIVATNRHVLAYWQETDSFLYFQQGYYMEAEILGVSEQYDVGFLSVDNGQFTYDELEGLQSAAADMAVYEQLKQGDGIFCVGAGPGPEVGELLFHTAVLEDRARYIADFGTDMLYGHGFARTGMSGGGIFDEYGHLIGMVTGGTLQNEVAGVPLPVISEAYQEIGSRAD